MQRWMAHFIAITCAILISGSGTVFGQSETAPPPALSDLLPTKPFRIDLESKAAQRYAIVIGNSDYAGVTGLPNAISDAEIVSDFLGAQGYDVRQHRNVTKRGFEDILRRVLVDVNEDTEVIFYFAGHGFQIGSENYLVPVDAVLDTPEDVPFETVSLGSLVAIIGSRARLQVVILDSCRNNPFAGAKLKVSVGSELRETQTGFSSLAAPVNSIVVFSTSPGALALDGNEGQNSPFTAALIETAAAHPEAQATDTFEAVRRLVYERTRGLQVPWDSSTLIEPVSFGRLSVNVSSTETSTESGGTTRGLSLVTSTAVAVNQAEESQSNWDAAIQTPYGRRLAIGSGLGEALNVAPSASLQVTEPPTLGRLGKIDNGTLREFAQGETIKTAELGDLVLMTDSFERPAKDVANTVVADQMRVAVGDTGYLVGINVLPDPCDIAAGDHLDPGGVGLTRYANEIEPNVALEACTAAIDREPENGRFHYQLGRALTALRRFDEAKKSYERARDLGHVRAWYALGNSVLNEARESGGKIEERAPDEALALYQHGVDEGDPYAMYALGRQYLRYGGSEAMEIRGYDLMLRSLELGHTFAMNELGYFYLNKHGKYYDPVRGLRYLRESAARNDIYGFNNMGLVYLNGLGDIKPDMKEAFNWFTKAAAGGQPNAPANLGRMYAEGLVDGKADILKAVEWLDVGLEHGDGSAGAYAAFIIATKAPKGLSMSDAALRAGKAAALRDPAVVKTSRDLLAAMPQENIDAATQILMNDLGEPVDVDGSFGAGSEASLSRVLEKFSAGVAKSNSTERLIQLARVYWSVSPFRVDLY